MRILELLGREVVAIKEAQTLGHVTAFAVRDYKYITHLILIKDGAESAVDVRSLYSVEEVITVPAVSALAADAPAVRLPEKGARVILTSGKAIGVVEDYICTGNYRLTSVVTEQKNYSCARIISMSNNLLIACDNVKKSLAAAPIVPAREIIPKIISDYSFLKGRKVSANILTIDKQLLIKQGAVITDEIIELARRHGKLVLLTVRSVPNI